MRRALVLAALMLAAPVALGQPAGTLDAVVALSPQAEPTIESVPGLIVVNESTPGERYTFDLTLTKEYTTFEFRAKGFGLDSPRQIVPTLVVPENVYPLFYDFPNERIWDVDGVGRVYHVNGTGDDIVLRLGIDGPRNVTLVLERDTTPPVFVLGEIEQLTHIGFYQETRTLELAIGDMQIRKKGTEEWIQNPTPEFHYRQRFPVQGLDADKDYEVRVLFSDWAGNVATSEIYTVHSASAPIVPIPIVTPLVPAANTTVAPGGVVVRARIESPESPVSSDNVRLFFDKKEVTQDVRFEGDLAVYTPLHTLAPGKHSVAFEVTNEAGGTGVARWSFDIEGAKDTPLQIFAALGAMVVAAILLARR